ncbi:MAG: DUF4105 domain-containing protein, partial [Gemmatimonadaceae bacterium]
MKNLRLAARFLGAALLALIVPNVSAEPSTSRPGPTATLAAASLTPRESQAQPSAEPGAELEMYLMTMGQGDEIWERFGHNALGIRNRSTGEDLVYNWGMFSFEQPGFVPHFLRGLMTYWMAPFDAPLTVLVYERMNRSVTVQELRLSNAQKASLRDFIEWNARDENKFYRYDYYRDNCSTRVRDALDKVLGGA